jgi:hypothetical protein
MSSWEVEGLAEDLLCRMAEEEPEVYDSGY